MLTRLAAAALLATGLLLAPSAFATTTPAATTPAATKPATPTGAPVFPAKIDEKYSKLSAGTGRMKTCSEQYKANKATGGNAGMKWIQKGGGYYSACSKHLKGA